MPPRFAGFVILLVVTHSSRCGLEEYRQLRWLKCPANLCFNNVWRLRRSVCVWSACSPPLRAGL